MKTVMTYPKLPVRLFMRFAKSLGLGLFSSAIALTSVKLAQAAPVDRIPRADAPIRPFPFPSAEVTPECTSLMSKIKAMGSINMNHTTLSNIDGKQSGGYADGNTSGRFGGLVPVSLNVNNNVAAGNGNRLLSDRLVPLLPDPNQNGGLVAMPTQPFDVNQPEPMAYSIDLTTATITLQNSPKRRITSCVSDKFAIVTTPTSVEVFSFAQGAIPPN
jgi:hypothetical protein